MIRLQVCGPYSPLIGPHKEIGFNLMKFIIPAEDLFRNMFRNSHSRAGYTIFDPGQDCGHLYWALDLEISARDGPVPP